MSDTQTSPVLSPDEQSAWDSQAAQQDEADKTGKPVAWSNDDQDAWNQAAQKEDENSNPSVQGNLFQLAAAPFPLVSNVLPDSFTGSKELTPEQRTVIAGSHVWNVAKAFGLGFYNADTEDVKNSDTIKVLKQEGMYKNYVDSEDAAHKSFMDGIIVPTLKTVAGGFNSTVANAELLGHAALLEANPLNVMNSVFAGADAAARKLGEETKIPGADTEFSYDLEVLGAEAGLKWEPHAVLPRGVADAKANGALEDDAVWNGAAPTPKQAEGMQNAAQMYPETHASEPAVVEPSSNAPAQTIHDVARQIDPEIFRQYDPLMARHESYTTWLGQLEDAKNGPIKEQIEARDKELEASAPHNDQIAELQAKIDAAGTKSTVKTARYQDLIKDFQSKNADWIAEQQKASGLEEALTADTPDMAAVRAARYKNALQLQKVADTGQVRDAYAEAAKRIPETETVEHGQEPAPKSAPVQEGFIRMYHGGHDPTSGGSRHVTPQYDYAKSYADKSGAPVHYVDVPEDASYMKKVFDDTGNSVKSPWSNTVVLEDIAAGFKEIKGSRKSIGAEETINKSDASKRSPEEAQANVQAAITKQLLATGRPAEEAEAAGQLFAARYQARADAFEGKRGDAQDMYEQHGARVVGKNSVQEGKKGAVALSSVTKEANTLIKLVRSNADASTIIHEAGHAWLDETVTDAQHELASDALKADAKAVRDWLGEKTGPYSGFTRAQHEKFARGFERFMREGIAPNKQLVGVFAKFKKWLDKIYQTVGQLRAPLTDEMRGVYGRMLASDKTVIAPDHAPGEMMARVHEQEAASTPPEHGNAVADNIEHEITLIAHQHAPEIEDAIKTAEAHGVEGTPAGGADTGAAAGAEPATTAEPGAQPAGSGGPAGEGVGAGTGTGSGSAGGNAPTSGSTGGPDGAATEGSGNAAGNDQNDGSNSAVGQPESALIDKAGNIRLDLLNTPDDLRKLVKDISAENDDFINARGGVITDDTRLRTAAAMGIDAAKLKLDTFAEQFGAGNLSAAVEGVRRFMNQSADNIHKLSIKAASSENIKDLQAYREAKARHVMMQQSLASSTAEWGRIGRAFQQIKETPLAGNINNVLTTLASQVGSEDDLFQLKREVKAIAAYDTPEQVSAFLNKKGSIGSGILEYWIHGLISGPATHMTYVIGNALTSIYRAGIDAPAAAALAAIRGSVREGLSAEDAQAFNALDAKRVSGEKLSPQEQSQYNNLVKNVSSDIKIGEVPARFKAMGAELPKALLGAGKSLKTGQAVMLKGEETASTVFDPNMTGVTVPDQVAWHEVAGGLFGTMTGLKQAIIGAGQLVKSGNGDLFALKDAPEGASIPDITFRGVNVLPIGSIARVPGRPVAAIHSFFRILNAASENAALAYRDAVKEGHTGEQLSIAVTKKMLNQSDENIAKINAYATDSALMAKGGKFTQAVSQLTNASVKFPGLGETKLLKFIDPFVKIGSNIIDQSIVQRTPLGLLSQGMRDDLSGVNSAEIRDNAQAKMLMGTALATLVGGLTAEGVISGSAPSDPKLAAMERLAGMQPHSVKVNGVWYDVHRLGPLGMLMGVAADMYQVAHSIGEESATKVGSMLVHAISQNILDESFMRGPAELMKALDDGDRYGDAYIRNLVSSFVPFSVGMGQEARAIDPYSRQTRTVMDSIMAKIPWESETLMPRRDVWGEKIPSREALGPDGLSAIYETRVRNDPVTTQLVKLGYSPAQPDRKIRGVELTEPQYDDYSRLAGRLLKMRLNNIMTQPGFANLPAEKQVDIVKKMVSSSREYARKAVMMQNPAIMQQAVAIKRGLVKK